MNKKAIISASNNAIFKLKVLAKEKESIRRKLVVIAGELRRKAKQLAVTAKQLAKTAKEKEDTRSKLAITAKQLAKTAKEKEEVRRKLVVTVEEKEDTRSKLAVTAKKLAVTAEEKEDTRSKLAVTAKQLAMTAKEKEIVRSKLEVTAGALRLKASQLAIIAKEKESVRSKLEDTAKDLAYAKATDEAMFDSIGDGLLATDEKGRITLINKTAETLLGKKSNAVMGKVFSKIILLEDEKGASIPAENHPINLALISGTTATGGGLTYYYARKDQTKFPLAIMATPIIIAGKVIGAIKVFRDITEEKEIDKAKSEFVSIASHQLKTPATIIGLYAEMLLNGPGSVTTAKQKEHINEIRSANSRMIDLVNTLLNVSRIEMGIFSVNPTPVDVIDVFKNVIKESEANFKEKRIIPQEKYHQLTHVIPIDKLLLNIVFSNLVSNSIKYTSMRGVISIESLEVKKGEYVNNKMIKENSLLVSVSDNGCGIPTDQQDKIFTRFFRSDNARREHTDGNGLGLYIIKSILDHIGGDVWFSSKEKEGTTFYFTVPLTINV